jgi:hypothetical protein
MVTCSDKRQVDDSPIALENGRVPVLNPHLYIFQIFSGSFSFQSFRCFRATQLSVRIICAIKEPLHCVTFYDSRHVFVRLELYILFGDRDMDSPLPSSDAASNYAYTLYVLADLSNPLPLPHRVNSFYTRIEDQVHDLPSRTIPSWEILDVPY